MTRKRGGGLRAEESLGVFDRPVGVPVAKPAVGDLAARNDPEAIITGRAAERPGRDPVHTAHVTGEEGGDERELTGEIGDRDKMFQHLPVDGLRGRLEAVPGQEHPHRVETGRGDPLEVSGNLSPVELRPPAVRAGQ
jgi:hypothetical protein